MYCTCFSVFLLYFHLLLHLLYIFIRISFVFSSSLYTFLRIYFVFSSLLYTFFSVNRNTYFLYFIFIICVSQYFFCIFIFHPIQSCNPNQQCHVSLRDPVMKLSHQKLHHPTNNDHLSFLPRSTFPIGISCTFDKELQLSAIM